MDEHRPARLDLSFLGVLGCFLLSGFSGLLYETVWARQFALVFGTSEPAVATVLAAYMGGLAVGAAAARRWMPRVRRPVRVYGLLELGIGLAALATPLAIRACAELSAVLFGGAPRLHESAEIPLTLFHLGCSFGILLIPTALMGATLPLLARFAIRSKREIGTRIGLLYATNGAGAVLGTLSSAFALLPRLGLQRTILVGVCVNAAVFGLATALARSEARRSAGSPPLRSPSPRSPLGRAGGILPLVLISGATSFTYEVLWTRLLGHVFGGTVYAFSTMLASFLAGIVLGSALAARAATHAGAALRRFAIAQLCVAASSMAAFLALDSIPRLALALGAGTRGGLAANAALAGLILLPGAVFIGATFPLAVRALARDEVEASPASARVYSWNTVGAIAGALGAGFVWLPVLGYPGTLVAATATNLLVAAAAGLLARPPRRLLAAVAAAGAPLVVCAPPDPPWRLLLTSPLDLAAGRPSVLLPAEVSYFGVGRSATVLLLGEDGGWTLRTNGLPEAEIRRRGEPLLDDPTQWLVALPLLARPEAESMLVVGLGGGSALEAIPHSLKAVDVIELEPEVLEANRRLRALRARDPLADPRIRVHLNDARGALLLSRARYDAIVSQPSHPWTEGASHLFTREFYQLVAKRLAPDGVFVQWMGLAFLDEELLRSLVATLNQAFPHLRMYGLRMGGSILLLASHQPVAVDEGVRRAVAASPESFAHLGVYGMEDLAALLALDEAGARRFGAGASLSTDDHNLFQLRSTLALEEPLDAAALASLIEPLDPLLTPSPDWSLPRLARRLLANGEVDRAERLARSAADPAEQLTIQALVDLARGQRSLAEGKLRDALRSDPDAVETRAALARARPWNPSAAFRGRPLAELEAVVRGWELAGAGRWEELAALEDQLRAVPPGHALHPDSLRLRARWRIDARDPALARQALALVDALLPLSHSPGDLVLRAQALVVGGQGGLALSTLARVAKGVERPDRALLDQMIELLGRLPEDEALLSRRNALSALIRQRLDSRLGGARERSERSA